MVGWPAATTKFRLSFNGSFKLLQWNRGMHQIEKETVHSHSYIHSDYILVLPRYHRRLIHNDIGKTGLVYDPRVYTHAQE